LKQTGKVLPCNPEACFDEYKGLRERAIGYQSTFSPNAFENPMRLCMACQTASEEEKTVLGCTNVNLGILWAEASPTRAQTDDGHSSGIDDAHDKATGDTQDYKGAGDDDAPISNDEDDVIYIEDEDDIEESGAVDSSDLEKEMPDKGELADEIDDTCEKTNEWEMLDDPCATCIQSYDPNPNLTYDPNPRLNYQRLYTVYPTYDDALAGVSKMVSCGQKMCTHVCTAEQIEKRRVFYAKTMTDIYTIPDYIYRPSWIRSHGFLD
jgi:hypothetical protein